MFKEVIESRFSRRLAFLLSIGARNSGNGPKSDRNIGY